MDFQYYFFLFIVYSIIGWIIEVIEKLVECKRFINRGFLIGPWLPIYGVGSLLITIFLQKYEHDPMVLFVMGMVICSILEYITSFVMEKVFKARWWDYSDDRFNINGRVSFNTMIPFGLLSVVLVCFLTPWITSLYNLINNHHLTIINIIVFIIFITDVVITIIVLLSIRTDNKLLERDNTEEMSKKVIEVIKNQGFLSKRLLNAFPDFRHVGIVIQKKSKLFRIKLKNYTDKYILRKEKIKEERDEKLNKLEYKYNKKREKIKTKSSNKIENLSKKNK